MSDGAGNPAVEVTRTVNVVDTTPPVISLNGPANVEVEVGSVYADAGATALDSVDGNLTVSIAVTGLPIDTSAVAGPFTIISMYLFSIVVAILNCRYLPVELRMPRWKLLGMYWAVVLWGWFSAETLSRFALRQIFGDTGPAGTSIVFHPVRFAFYFGWLASLAWLVIKTARPGLIRSHTKPND